MRSTSGTASTTAGAPRHTSTTSTGDWLTTADVAEALSTDARGVLALIDAGELTAERCPAGLCGGWHITERSLHEHIAWLCAQTGAFPAVTR
jgi:hypothetical protein